MSNIAIDANDANDTVDATDALLWRLSLLSSEAKSTTGSSYSFSEVLDIDAEEDAIGTFLGLDVVLYNDEEDDVIFVVVELSGLSLWDIIPSWEISWLIYWGWGGVVQTK